MTRHELKPTSGMVSRYERAGFHYVEHPIPHATVLEATRRLCFYTDAVAVLEGADIRAGFRAVRFSPLNSEFTVIEVGSMTPDPTNYGREWQRASIITTDIARTIPDGGQRILAFLRFGRDEREQIHAPSLLRVHGEDISFSIEGKKVTASSREEGKLAHLNSFSVVPAIDDVLASIGDQSVNSFDIIYGSLSPEELIEECQFKAPPGAIGSGPEALVSAQAFLRGYIQSASSELLIAMIEEAVMRRK